MDNFDFIVEEPTAGRKTNYDRFVAKLIKNHPSTWVKFTTPFATRNVTSSARQAFKKRGCDTKVVEVDDDFYLYVRFQMEEPNGAG